MFQAVQWLLRQPSSCLASRKFVLAVLYDVADANGICWPGVAYIAKVTGLSERTVRSALKELTRDGAITRQHRKKPDGEPDSDLTTVNWPNEVAALLKDARDRKNFPGPTGNGCRLKEQNHNNRQEERLDDLELFETMPEANDHRPLRNQVRDLSAILRRVAGSIEWGAAGIQNTTVLRIWLSKCNWYFVVAVLAETAARHKRSKNGSQPIQSWKFFVDEIQKQFESDPPSAERDADGRWKRRAEKWMRDAKS